MGSGNACGSTAAVMPLSGQQPFVASCPRCWSFTSYVLWTTEQYLIHIVSATFHTHTVMHVLWVPLCSELLSDTPFPSTQARCWFWLEGGSDFQIKKRRTDSKLGIGLEPTPRLPVEKGTSAFFPWIPAFPESQCSLSGPLSFLSARHLTVLEA